MGKFGLRVRTKWPRKFFVFARYAQLCVDFVPDAIFNIADVETKGSINAHFFLKLCRFGEFVIAYLGRNDNKFPDRNTEAA